eukprot:4157748-Amphidinium_carterae.1
MGLMPQGLHMTTTFAGKERCSGRLSPLSERDSVRHSFFKLHRIIRTLVVVIAIRRDRATTMGLEDDFQII